MSTFSISRDRPRPNIVLVTTDDQGTQAGCYGDRFAQTPRLDAFVRDGVRFARGYVTAASCSPSRSSMLTGMYPHQNGQLGLAHVGYYRMHDAIPTLPRVLEDAGYFTGILGKLHIAPDDAFPFGYRHTGNVFETRDKFIVRQRMNAFLDEAAGAPFFFMCNLFDPHPPYDLEPLDGLPDPLITANDIEPFPWLGLDSPAIRDETAKIYNLTHRADACFGAVLDVLERRGLSNDTLVIYIGDNGPNFARAKTTCYEAGVHVPFAMRWPGVIPRRTVYHGFASAVDIVPTICRAVGMRWPVYLPGHSLIGAAAGARLPRRRFLCTESHAHLPEHWYPRRAIRGVRYKLIRNYLQDRWNPVPWLGAERELLQGRDAPGRARLATFLNPPPVELYDLARDPHEWNNLADEASLSSVRGFLEAALFDWQRDTGDPFLDLVHLAAVTAEHDAYRAARQQSG